MDVTTCAILFAFWTSIYYFSDFLSGHLEHYMKRQFSCNVHPKFSRQFAGYVVSTVHALITTYRGFSHMYALKSNPDTARVPMALYSNAFYSYFVEDVRAGVVITNQMVLTYMAHDLVHSIARFPDLGGIDSILHHVIFLMASFTAGWNKIFCFPFSWLVVGELSTPFLNVRWFLRATGQKESAFGSINNLLFALTFFIARVLIFGSGILEMINDFDFVWNGIVPQWGVRYVVINIFAAFLLNLFWFFKIAQGIVRLFTTPTKSQGDKPKKLPVSPTNGARTE
eukprot:TRINITY_DN11165_c0_g1_i1.p1 TRINITY_DN11165_c0_g1~~TRINITY_DN11165_c0_g1_i1.p1  ORF type:complete len:295 (+),score=60.86 TRINITY_DN11165_c0_g1_i1:38-886(+)